MLINHPFSQLASTTSELERSKGELAATNVRLTNMESQLEQTRNDIKSKEAKIKQLRVSTENTQCKYIWSLLLVTLFQFELETQQQAGARYEATLQSLRQQLSKATEAKTHFPSSGELTELQTEVGRLKNELKEKVCPTV